MGRRLHGVSSALALPVVLLLAACSTRSELRFSSVMSEVPATKAIILPPPGGPAIVGVVERTYLNGVSQEIALATAASTPGQSAFYVSMINDAEALSEVDDTLRIRRVTPRLIESEMETRLPDIPMRTSLFYAQNKFGPFGFATGRSSAGDLCLYAWQQIEPNTPAILTTSGAISVRLRLCDSDATEEQLLRAMYSYTIAAYFESDNWNPFGDPPAVSPDLGESGAPHNPLESGEFGSAKPVPSVIPVRSRSVSKDIETSPVAPVRQEPLSGYPTVPPPP